MSELHINGSPVFVDVSSDAPFPILYSQLLQPQGGNTEEATVRSKDSNSAVTCEKTQPSKDPPQLNEQQQQSQTDATNACIKIEKRRLKCPECKRFTCETEEKMLRHIRRVHRGENPFQCAMCEYSTYNKAVFEEHVRVHQGIKPFKCSVCKYRSASKKNVKKHELIHRSDNPLKCKDCDFIGKHTTSYKAHRAKYHSESHVECGVKYSCNICNRAFPDRKKRHNHYKNKKLCTACSFVSCSKKLMTKHMQFDHGEIPDIKKDSNTFTCALCPWASSSKPRILLHLIHHPNQTVDENIVDISVLRRCGIMT